MTTNTCAVIYAAKSTDDVRGSIGTQITDCEAMAKRENLTVLGSYNDEAKSAYHGSRGDGLVKAREHAERLALEYGECALIVQHSDRLARGDGIAAQHLVEVLLWARKANVRVRSVQDDSTGENLLLAAVMGERNHEDSKRKAAACAAGKRRSAERGEPNGVVPDGYAVERTVNGTQVLRHIVFDPERQPVYRLIWDLALKDTTVNTIVRELDAHGYQTAPRRNVHRSRPFDSTRIRRSLATPFYAGLVISRGEILGSGNWPAYIEPDDWYRLCKERSNRNRHRPRPVGRPPSGMLSKIARCAECGTSVVHETGSRVRADGTKARSYVCIDHRHRPNGCKALPFDAAQVERMILENLDRLLGEQQAWADVLIASHTQERARLDDEVSRAQDEISECERAVDQLVERYDTAALAEDEIEVDLARRAMASRKQMAARAKIRLQAARDALSEGEPDDEDAGKLVFARLWESLNGALTAADGDVRALRDALAEHFDHFDLRHDYDGAVQVFPFLSAEAITRARHDRSILQAHSILDARKSASAKCGA